MVGQGIVDRHPIDCVDYRIALSRGRPTTIFKDKAQEKALAKIMKEKYGMHIGAHKLDFMRINDDIVILAMQVMTCKLLRKSCKD
jgi:hypothetical protein